MTHVVEQSGHSQVGQVATSTIGIHGKGGVLDPRSLLHGIEAPLRQCSGSKRMLKAAVSSGGIDVVNQSGLLYAPKPLEYGGNL